MAAFISSNPLEVSIPYTFNQLSELPTEVMAGRFQAWRVVIKDLSNYLKEYASVEEEIVRQQARLQHAASQSLGSISGPQQKSAHHHSGSDTISALLVFLPSGNGSILDIPSVLSAFHQKNVVNGSKTLKEINVVLIPKLEELRSDLLVKIKEIKNLQSDFRTGLAKELVETKSLIHAYIQAVDQASKDSSRQGSSASILSESHSDLPKQDPYLFKLKLDRQLKRQLSEEHYLHNAYINLQTSGSKLESIVVQEIQSYLSTFVSLITAESEPLFNFLAPTLRGGFLSKEENFEWDAFVSRNLPELRAGTFIDLSVPLRRMNDLNIPNYDLQLNFPVHQGWLERRSKYLKLYSPGWYVLTCGFLHEFKSEDRKHDPTPLMLLPLNGCTVTEHSKDDGKALGVYKFILSALLPSGGLMHRSHNWVFRTTTFSQMMRWYTDIKTMTSLPTPIARARYLEKNRPDLSTSLRPVSSRVSSVVLPRPGRVSLDSARNTSLRTTTMLYVTRAMSHKQGAPAPALQAPLINSVGNVITPIDADAKRAHHVPEVSIEHQAPGFQQTNRDHVSFDQQGAHSLSQDVASYTQLPQLMPTYLIPTPGPQQVYDPVQQRYFTLTPSLPGTMPQGQGVQPQYPAIPGSPQPPQINTGNYFKQFASQGDGSGQFEESLPYPGNGADIAIQRDDHGAMRDIHDAEVEDVSTLATK